MDSYLTEQIKLVIRELDLIDTGLMLATTEVYWDENLLQFRISSTDYFEIVDYNYGIVDMFLNKNSVKVYISNIIKEYIVMNIKNN